MEGINKTARQVLGDQPDDESYRAFNCGNNYMSLNKPPTQTYKGYKSNDLTGLKFGTLTVIGVFILQNPKKKLKWLTQCLCGYYVVRNSNVIKRKVKHKEQDTCQRCNRSHININQKTIRWKRKLKS